MKELLDKLSSYNIFNFLFPGILFSVFAEAITNYKFVVEDVITSLFMSYFIGMIVSRVGSLVIEPLLKRLSYIKFSNYNAFISASKKDEKIELLSEINNVYRTIVSTLFLLLLLKGYELLEIRFIVLRDYSLYILICGLLIIFLESYRKQTKYINERISTKRAK